MRDSGLGTPATRAAIIETLLKRGFVVREGKHVVPTPMGIGLIDALPVPNLASPELTGAWEARLSRIARKEEQREVFMRDIASYVGEVVDAIRKAAPMAALPVSPQVAPKGQRCFAAKTSGASNAAKTAGKPASPKRKKAQAPREVAQAAPPARPASPADQNLVDLLCPACKRGHIITGKRGWGCERWREGCKFVVWFEEEGGKKRTLADLRALVSSE
jgi:DNA topoisomerase-3